VYLQLAKCDKESGEEKALVAVPDEELVAKKAEYQAKKQRLSKLEERRERCLANLRLVRVRIPTEDLDAADAEADSFGVEDFEEEIIYREKVVADLDAKFEAELPAPHYRAAFPDTDPDSETESVKERRKSYFKHSSLSSKATEESDTSADYSSDDMDDEMDDYNDMELMPNGQFANDMAWMYYDS
jgi:hypothetical protein